MKTPLISAKVIEIKESAGVVVSDVERLSGLVRERLRRETALSDELINTIVKCFGHYTYHHLVARKTDNFRKHF
jgi:hypothetical protein